MPVIAHHDTPAAKDFFDRTILISESRRLAEAVRQLRREPVVAVDTESNGYHRYPERICLVQLAAHEQCYLVDALACNDMAPLGEFLADAKIEKVFHSADYDLRSLDREWGFRVRGLWDTSIAARFAGLDHLGLASAVERFLGVTLNKTKRLQRADWSLRPLSDPALAYAAADVLHLLPLRDAIEQRLNELGRMAWAREECARMETIRYAPPEPPETACLSIKGSKALDGQGLAILARLIAWREAEARRRNRPPFRVLSDETLVRLSANPQAGFDETPGIGPWMHGRTRVSLQQALQQGLSAHPIQRPAPTEPLRPRMTSQESLRYDKLRGWRTQRGTALGFDVALVWPMTSLDRLARGLTTIDDEMTAPEVRRWQAEQFGPPLRAFIATLPNSHTAGAQRQRRRR